MWCCGQGGGERKEEVAEEIFCHDHETTRQRSNLIGGGCGGARGEEKKTRTRNNESDGWCTLEKRGDGRNEVILEDLSKTHTVFVFSVWPYLGCTAVPVYALKVG